MEHNPPITAPISLTQAADHNLLQIVSIVGGWGVRRNLNQIGLHVGDRLRILRRAPFGGPLVVEIHGASVAIGRGLAEKIKVEVLS